MGELMGKSWVIVCCVLWYPDLVDKIRAVMHSKEEMAVELARGPDADAKCTVYIQGDMGKKRYDWEVVNQYGKLLHEYFTNRSAFQVLATLFDAPPGQV